MLHIIQFPCLDDNYCVLLHDQESGHTAAIDAPDSDAVIHELEARDWELTHILTTHHHSDHVDGNLVLKEKYGCKIIGPKAEADKIPGIDDQVVVGDVFAFAGVSIQVMDAKGHTNGQVAYYIPSECTLFTADSLFSLGCGRLFEGTPQDMWQSLHAFRDLPEDTKVYCGHEYTLSNARFAITVDPDNEKLKSRVLEVEALREQGKPTLPTTISLEKATNPFMRPDSPQIRIALDMLSASDDDVFTELRKRKDNF